VGLFHGECDGNVPVAGARRLAERLPEGELTTLPEADHLGTLLAYRSRGFGDD
jgi:pimeloyl-ACP methyl ester carboxylesterase